MGTPETLESKVRKKLLREFTSFAALIIGLGSGVAQLVGWPAGVGRILLIVLCVVCFLYLIVRFAVLFYVRRIEQVRQERDEAQEEMTQLRRDTANERDRARREMTQLRQNSHQQMEQLRQVSRQEMEQLRQVNRQEMEQVRQDTRQELAAQQVAHQSYVEAINRIIDQEGPIYAESLELTVVIGTGDDGDTVVERRVTTPLPRVIQRAIRPIVPEGNDRIVGLDDIGLHCKIETISGTITPRPLVSTGKPRVWLVFEPGLTETFTWQISYNSRGLWAPLRARGSDYLIWNDRLPAGNGAKSVLSELTVRFVFPASDKAPTVHERHGFGRANAAEPREGGWLIVWVDPEPAGRRYEWDLAQVR